MRQNFRVSSFLFFTLVSMAVASGANANPNSSTLTVEIDGLKSRQGQICLSVFASSQGFPSSSSNAVQNQCVPVTKKSLLVTFRNLKPGSYAVSALHDTKGDQKIHRNILGIPTEGFGFSSNPTILTGPPKFGDSAFLVVGPNTNIQIQLIYF